MTAGDPGATNIIRPSGGSREEQLAWTAAIRSIFFEAAVTRAFASPADKAAYEDRWLGRYLARFPQECFVAVDAHGTVHGYLVGCPDSAAAAEIFSDIPFYARLMPHYADYPAHIHVNLRNGSRGRGIGKSLVEAFASHCRERSIAGIHAVTAEGSRAAKFFEVCGLHPVTTVDWDGRALIMLGRRL